MLILQYLSNRALVWRKALFVLRKFLRKYCITTRLSEGVVMAVRLGKAKLSILFGFRRWKYLWREISIMAMTSCFVVFRHVPLVSILAYLTCENK